VARAHRLPFPSRSQGSAVGNVAVAIPALIVSCQGRLFCRPTPEPHQESTISADRLCKNPSDRSSAHSGSPCQKGERVGLVMTYLPLKILTLSIAVGTLGWAQGNPQTAGDQGQQEPPATEPAASPSFPFDVAGYINFRYVNDDAFQEHNFYRDYSASLFLSKTLGRWRFHAEFNADTAAEYDDEGIHLLPKRPSLSVTLDSAFVNYNAWDWLQLQGGLLFIPTYWRTHRYQSTTLTVDEPLIDQTVFPTALKGVALYGDRYWGSGGASYIVCGGVDQQSQFQESTEVVEIETAHTIGGKLTLHVPSRQFFNTFDVAVQRLHRVGTDDGKPDEIYGVELHLSKSRYELLGEFAHDSMDVVDGVRSYIRQYPSRALRSAFLPDYSKAVCRGPL
jgi:hypothetical protein